MQVLHFIPSSSAFMKYVNSICTLVGLTVVDNIRY